MKSTSNRVANRFIKISLKVLKLVTPNFIKEEGYTSYIGNFPAEDKRTPPSASKMYKIIQFCTNLKLRNGNFSLLRSSADVCLETVSNTSYVRVSDG